MDKTKIQESQLKTKNQDSTVGIGIRNTLAQTENKEDPTSIQTSTIGSRTENKVNPTDTKILTIRSKTKYELPTKNLCFRIETPNSKQSTGILTQLKSQSQ